MRVLWGGVSLLLVLALVGWLAKTQLRPPRQDTPQGPAQAASAVGLDPTTSARDLPRQVQDDVTRAMQAASARGDDVR